MDKRRKFMHQWVTLNFNGTIRRAKIEDIEFETGCGPRFYMVTSFGNSFWLSRQELRDHEVASN